MPEEQPQQTQPDRANPKRYAARLSELINGLEKDPATAAATGPVLRAMREGMKEIIIEINLDTELDREEAATVSNAFATLVKVLGEYETARAPAPQQFEPLRR